MQGRYRETVVHTTCPTCTETAAQLGSLDACQPKFGIGWKLHTHTERALQYIPLMHAYAIHDLKMIWHIRGAIGQHTCTVTRMHTRSAPQSTCRTAVTSQIMQLHLADRRIAQRLQTRNSREPTLLYRNTGSHHTTLSQGQMTLAGPSQRRKHHSPWWWDQG